MRHFITLCIAALCFWGVSSTISLAQDTDKEKKAENLIQKNVESTLTYISSAEVTSEQKKKRFKKMLDQNFDLKTIGRFSLGRNWRKLPKESQDTYFSLFKDYVANVYAQRFNDYSGEKFKVTGSRTEKNKDIIVFSALIPQKGGQGVLIDWRLRERKTGLKIIDVIVEGISMSITQRSDFTSVIQRSGGDTSALLAFLKEQNDKQSLAAKKQTLAANN